MNILLVCGETSSNNYGIELAITLKKANHNVYSIGDRYLATKTTQVYKIDSANHSVNIGQWMYRHKLIKKMRAAVINYHQQFIFDRVVIIDFPTYNFSIAKVFQLLNIPITTFITPNFWMWKQKRLAKRLVNYSDKIITIYKKEYEFYKQMTNKPIYYFGHPISCSKSIVDQKRIDNSHHTIGIFPGSRHSEINNQLPRICKVISKLKKKISIDFVIECANKTVISTIEKILNQHDCDDIPIVQKIDISLNLAIATPGTITLKLVLMRVPMVIIGRVSSFSYFIAKYVLRLNIPFVGLPNAIINQMICPEYIQNKVPVSTIVSKIKHLISGNNSADMVMAYESIIKEFQAEKDYYEKIVDII